MNIDDLVALYDASVGGVDSAAQSSDRAYGGVVRATKGKLVEQMAPHLVSLAWESLARDPARLSFNDVRTFQVHVQEDYIRRLEPRVRSYIEERKNLHFYRAQVDVHVFVDTVLVMGVECKAYAENAMLKRIMVDFGMLRALHPKLACCLLQLESMLGGDYAEPLASPQYGSPSTHTIMSLFPEVDLDIITLLRHPRDVRRPIHLPEFRKELKREYLRQAVSRFAAVLEQAVMRVGVGGRSRLRP